MIVITWNIQWCRGVDGRVDPVRIAQTARSMADFDILCLQEVAVHFPGLAGSGGEDQVAELASALPGYFGIFGAATDLAGDAGERQQFGNAIFTRLPILQVFRHLLPWPADARSPSMQRLALEAVLATPSGPVRVTSTHLEYYSQPQRMAQVAGLRRLHEEACGHARAPRPDEEEPGSAFSPAPRPLSAIVCGDLNFKASDPEHALLMAPFAEGEPAFHDAWQVAHPGLAHAPTVGVHDKSWPLYCCDFVFVTADLAPRVRKVEVNSITDASDHQPILLELA